MPAALDREQQPFVFSREVDGGTDIRRARDLSDQRGSLVEGRVEDLTSPVVAVVTRHQHAPFQPRSEVGNGLGSKCDFSTVARDRPQIGRNPGSRAKSRVGKGRFEALGKWKSDRGGGAEARPKEGAALYEWPPVSRGVSLEITD